MEYAEKLINQCIQANLKILVYEKDKIKNNIIRDVSNINDVEDLKKEIINYRINAETQNINSLIARIYNFRIE